jgi:hypothetical protein
MPSRTFPAFLLPFCLAACATNSPEPAPLYVYHIGAVGCFGSPADGTMLRVEDRPAEGLFRVSNVTASDIEFHYDVASSFGDYQMLFVRFRDGAGNPVPIPGMQNCDYFSPKLYWSDLIPEGEVPDRKSFTVPAGGSIDIRTNLDGFFNWWHGPKTATGPCQVQVRLFGYPGPRTWNGIGAVTEWRPSPCPGR